MAPENIGIYLSFIKKAKKQVKIKGVLG